MTTKQDQAIKGGLGNLIAPARGFTGNPVSITMTPRLGGQFLARWVSGRSGPLRFPSRSPKGSPPLLLRK